MGSNPVEESDFFLCPTLVTMKLSILINYYLFAEQKVFISTTKKSAEEHILRLTLPIGVEGIDYELQLLLS